MGKTFIVVSIIVVVAQAWTSQGTRLYSTQRSTVRRNYQRPGLTNGVTQRADTVSRPFFKAAVYEHAVVLPLLPFYSRQAALKAMWTNLDIYEDQVASASLQGADIIVFPEDGVYGMVMTRRKIEPFLEYIPDPQKETWNPCEEPHKYPNTDVQWRLSCMAKNNSIYIVANIGDRKFCNKTADPRCPDDGRYQYNTDVVYSPEGTLVARYHKYNLFDEPQFDQPTIAEEIFFDTHFGRFGLFTCFDILFRSPSVDLIEKHNVDTVLFPTAWMDALPLLAAIEYHSAFAVMMQVNLLSANIHLPSLRFGGSGIFTPVGDAAFYRDDTSHNGRLLLATIPTPFLRQPYLSDHKISKIILSNSSHHCYEFDQTRSCDYNSLCEYFQSIVFHDLYNFVWLKGSSGNLNVCSGAACCYLDYEMATSGNAYFALGAFDGLHSDKKSYYFQVCTLLKCANSTGSSCGEVVQESSTYFSHIQLRGQFNTSYIAPEILVMDEKRGLALVSSGWFYDRNLQTLRADGLLRPVISVNLLGRWYEKDPS
ncbi:pantetheinase-like [Liolophura sinensis]|uniref:pantetheinase-like n=1 Tax=Liolophura sinensis TaxID=3198878 RepID=UPI0031586B3F